MAREMDEAGVIDETNTLRVERKMRFARTFQAGLIAPEVYLLKAREYASEVFEAGFR